MNPMVQDGENVIRRYLATATTLGEEMSRIVDAMPDGCVNYVSFDHDGNISCNGDQHQLTQMIRVLRTNGWSTKADPPKPKEASYAARYKKEGYPDLWLVFHSTVCRRVKVGTKMEEVDVYETVCGEVELP